MMPLKKSATLSNCDYKNLARQYQMSGSTVDPRPKRGPDVKVLIQTLKMNPKLEPNSSDHRANVCNPAKMFKSVIQRANDSGSMDTSLEYKPLAMPKSTQNHKIAYFDELREIFKENKNIQINNVQQKIGTPSKLPFANRKNLPTTPIDSESRPKSNNNASNKPKLCEKFIETIKMSKKMPASSTPYRPKLDNETNNNCKGEINLMTPSTYVRFIDSDTETIDDDFNSKTLVKCYSLTRASCRRMSSFRKSFRKQSIKSDILTSTSPTFERRSLFSSSFNGTSNRSSIISTTEVSPLRRQRNIKIKNSKFLNFFRPSRVYAEDSEMKYESNLTQTCNNLTDLLAKSNRNFEELGCAPLLTKDNISIYNGNEDELDDCDKTIEWDNKFEFSYICEPSTSDIGDEDDFECFSTTESESKLQTHIPFVRISPPSIESRESYYMKQGNAIEYNSSAFSPFRRSTSDPALIRLATHFDKEHLGLNDGNDFNDPLDFYNCAPGNITRTLPNSSSPFRRWGQSSFRSRSNDLTPNNLTNHRPSSLVASENDVYSKSANNDDGTCSFKSKGSDSPSASSTTVTVGNDSTSHGVQVWGNSFEKLLEDAAGLHTFAEFLKKEFSAENIYFWTACERYRKIADHALRTKEAIAIFSKHLATGASEPVNVDSKARTLAQERLNYAEQDLFVQAQKQIFNLMKFDSYQRFIRSDLYKTCLAAEQQKQPLPYPGHQLDPSLRTSMEMCEKSAAMATSSKLKKSLSNAEDRRRKSLLPWHRKTRCKSKDRNEEFLRNESNKNTTPANQHLNKNVHQSQNDIHSSRSSLSSFDAVISSRANGSISPVGSGDDSPPRSSLCRVILSDGATTIVQTRHHESIRTLIDRLLEKRGIFYEAYEGFIAGTNKPIDLNVASTSVAGKEILIEQRVVFKLDLPNKKIISVKSKPCKMMSEVLKPILQKYNYHLDMVTVYTKTNSEPLPMNAPVTCADGLRLQVVFNDDVQQETTLNEITNKVFNELMQKKTDLQSKNMDISQGSSLQINQQQQQQQHIPNQSDDWCSESSSGNFGQLRQPIGKGRSLVPINKQRKFSVTPSSSNVSILTSASSKDNTSTSSKTITDGSNSLTINIVSNDEANKKPLIAKWKTGVRVQNASSPTTTPESKDLLEGLKRAQRFRLEDQRGTEINFELPDFLKDNKWKNRKSSSTDASNSRDISDSETNKKPAGKAPQPAPRLSINRNNSHDNSVYSDGDKHQDPYSSHSQGSEQSDSSPQKYTNGTVPPPLPPKPKIKPSSWAGNSNWQLNDAIKHDGNTSDSQQNLLAHSIRNVKAPIADRINMLSATMADKKMTQPRTIYFDRMNSSFV